MHGSHQATRTSRLNLRRIVLRVAAVRLAGLSGVGGSLLVAAELIAVHSGLFVLEGETHSGRRPAPVRIIT